MFKDDNSRRVSVGGVVDNSRESRERRGSKTNSLNNIKLTQQQQMYMPTSSPASLHLSVCSARNLARRDGGRLNPYVVCELGSTCEKTETKKHSGEQPFWNQQFTIPTTTHGGGPLLITVKQRDLFSHSTLGFAHVYLPPVGELRDIWVGLRDEKSNRPTGGEMHLVLQLDEDEPSSQHVEISGPVVPDSNREKRRPTLSTIGETSSSTSSLRAVLPKAPKLSAWLNRSSSASPQLNSSTRANGNTLDYLSITPVTSPFYSPPNNVSTKSRENARDSINLRLTRSNSPPPIPMRPLPSPHTQGRSAESSGNFQQGEQYALRFNHADNTVSKSRNRDVFMNDNDDGNVNASDERGELNWRDRSRLSRAESFEFHATASFLNDVLGSLEEVKLLIEQTTTQSKELSPPKRKQDASIRSSNRDAKDPSLQRVMLLSKAKSLLAMVEHEVANEKIGTLSDEWRSNLVELVAEYRRRVQMLFQSKAWERVRLRSLQIPVALTEITQQGIGERFQRLSVQDEADYASNEDEDSHYGEHGSNGTAHSSSSSSSNNNNSEDSRSNSGERRKYDGKCGDSSTVVCSDNDSSYNDDIESGDERDGVTQGRDCNGDKKQSNMLDDDIGGNRQRYQDAESSREDILVHNVSRKQRNLRVCDEKVERELSSDSEGNDTDVAVVVEDSEDKDTIWHTDSIKNSDRGDARLKHTSHEHNESNKPERQTHRNEHANTSPPSDKLKSSVSDAVAQRKSRITRIAQMSAARTATNIIDPGDDNDSLQQKKTPQPHEVLPLPDMPTRPKTRSPAPPPTLPPRPSGRVRHSPELPPRDEPSERDESLERDDDVDMAEDDEDRNELRGIQRSPPLPARDFVVPNLNPSGSNFRPIESNHSPPSGSPTLVPPPPPTPPRPTTDALFAAFEELQNGGTPPVKQPEQQQTRQNYYKSKRFIGNKNKNKNSVVDRERTRRSTLTVPRHKARRHVVATMEAFDDLVHHGVAVSIKNDATGGYINQDDYETRQNISKSHRIVEGDKVTLEYRALVWDPTQTLAVEYASSIDHTAKTTPPLVIVVGNEDVCEGLDAAVVGLSEGCHFVATIAPERGFGEEGNESGVPPDSHVVFDARIVNVEVREA